MRIHSFESAAAVDGDGVRYCVFLRGCPLRCVYCHNPDTWEMGGEDICVEKVAKKILRYKPYFKNGGGVTFSGGEPLLHSEEISRIGDLLKKDNIGYALDTSGCVELTENVKKAVDGAELIICDLKFWDEESYKKYTGGSFEKVMSFLEYCEKKGKRLWIRTVVVPNINDNIDIMNKYIEIVRKLKMVEKYKLLPFHTMGFEKYEKLAIKNPLESTKPMDIQKISELQTHINKQLER